MTRIFQRDVAQATHAFVIGVGDYPHAKPGQGRNPKLRVVKDLASAADSAKLVCDWLLDNRDKLVAPLGSIEVLISDVAQAPPAGLARYEAHNQELAVPIDRAEADPIVRAGRDWMNRLELDHGSTAIFYACGHGASHGLQPTLFHSDLNLRAGGDAWSHVNVGKMAQAFRQQTHIKAAFFFLDACGEFVPIFPTGASETSFISPDIPQSTDRDKVCLISAASAGLLAYEGVAEEAGEVIADRDPEYEGDLAAAGGMVRIGRFTQTLLKSLGGASARWDGTSWAVDNMGVLSDLKPIHRIYFPHWKDRLFEPTQGPNQNDRFPIIRYTEVRLPVVVLTDPPQRTKDFDLKIALSQNGEDGSLDHRDARAPHAWLAHVDGDRTRPFYALAVDGALCYSSFFQADQPRFDHRVTVP